MKPYLLPALCAAAVLWCPPAARGAVIQLMPLNKTVVAGDTVSLDMVISSLGGSVVGDFDLDISFDDSLMTLTGVDLSPALGDVLAGEAFDFSLGSIGPGLVNVAEVSALSAVVLGGLQFEPFSLASLVFQVGALGPGATTSVQLAVVNALGDGAGLAIPVGSIASSTLTGAGSNAVVEPALSFLVLSGLWAAAGRTRRWSRSRGGGRSG